MDSSAPAGARILLPERQVYWSTGTADCPRVEKGPRKWLLGEGARIRRGLQSQVFLALKRVSPALPCPRRAHPTFRMCPPLALVSALSEGRPALT